MSSPTAELSPLSLHDALPIWEPAPRCDVMLQGYVVGRIVLLHQAVPIGAAEIENVVRILLEEREIVPHRFREILPNNLRVLPPPLRVEMRVAHDVKRGLLREIWGR